MLPVIVMLSQIYYKLMVGILLFCQVAIIQIHKTVAMTIQIEKINILLL